MEVGVSYPKIKATVSDKQSRLVTWVIEHKYFVVAFAALMVVALLLRLTILNRTLPYTDYSDELVHFHLAQHLRNVPDAAFLPDKYAAPTFYGYFNAAVQIVFETLEPHPWFILSAYIHALRITSLIAGLCTVLLIGTIGWQLGGPVAAWMAALVWAVAPTIVESNTLALPDPFVYLFTALMLTATIRAWRTESPRWLFLSLIGGLLVIYSKFWLVTAVIPFVVVALVMFIRHPRKLLPWMIVYAVVAGAAAWYLLIVVDPLQLSTDAREVESFRSDGLSMALSPDRNFNNWYFAIYPIGHIVFYATIIAGLVAYWYNRERRVRYWREIILIVVFCIFTVMMSATFTYVWLGAGKIRHSLPVTIALLPLWGAAIAQIVWAVQQWFAKHKPAARLNWLAPAGVLLLIGMGIAPQIVSGNLELIDKFKHTAVQVQMWRWSDVNIPPEGLILGHEGSFVAHTWNRPWSGYDGVKTFRWWLEDETQMAASTPERYIERGITYFVMDDRDLQRYYSTPEMQTLINQLTLVKSFPVTESQFQFNTYFYRMMPPQFAADAVFGDQIVLAGYDLSAETIAPGETLVFRPYWHTSRQPDTNYSMFIHLYPTDSETLIAQYDGAPTVAERPTLTWDDTAELYIGSDINLIIPPETAPGDYRLAIGLYDFTNGPRLNLTDGADKFIIPLTVE